MKNNSREINPITSLTCCSIYLTCWCVTCVLVWSVSSHHLFYLKGLCRKFHFSRRLLFLIHRLDSGDICGFLWGFQWLLANHTYDMIINGATEKNSSVIQLNWLMSCRFHYEKHLDVKTRSCPMCSLSERAHAPPFGLKNTFIRKSTKEISKKGQSVRSHFLWGFLVTWMN